MSLRRLIVEVDPSSLNVREFCALHGVSTWFFYDLRRRHEAEGDIVLEPRSRAPHTSGNRTAPWIEDAIIAQRKELADAGLDAGPATIAFHLRDLDGLPSESTIYRILKARGFIKAQPTKAPKRSGKRFVAKRANDCWGLDDTAWALADDTGVKILNVIDDHSRLLIASDALETCTGAATLQSMGSAASVLGWPARFLSDNAPAFRNVLADALAPMGIGAGHSRPYHPQTNGKVERFHQTLKRWLAAQPRPDTLADLQAQLDIFRVIYNHHRPHRGINRQIPAVVWADAPKGAPANHPLGTPTRIYNTTVTSGRIEIAKRYRIALGVEHNNQRALTLITGTACHVFINGRLVHQLVIDSSRKYQPRYTQPGRPPRTHLP